MLDLESRLLKNIILHRSALLEAIGKDEYIHSNQSVSVELHNVHTLLNGCPDFLLRTVNEQWGAQGAYIFQGLRTYA